LGGSYWQRASFDAVVVIVALLGLFVVAPTVEQFRPHHWATAAALAVAVGIFGVGLVRSFRYAGRLLTRVQVIEKSQPPLP
jgi:protein-S-isoprenylcysteine O-methyltransferase Ste14